MDHNYSGLKDLIEKYRQNSLSPEELARLRDMVNTTSDSELLGLLEENGSRMSRLVTIPKASSGLRTA